jgi:hypothetical protein
MNLALTNYQRGAVHGEGFWADEDAMFPLASYERLPEKKRSGKDARI